jgi:hypothetical protein
MKLPNITLILYIYRNIYWRFLTVVLEVSNLGVQVRHVQNRSSAGPEVPPATLSQMAGAQRKG